MVAPSVCCGGSEGGQAPVPVLVDEIVGWRAGLDDLLARSAHRFGRAEPRRQALTYLVGLLSPLASKNGWTLAEAAGDTTPDRMQRLLNRSAWDPDAVRDDLFAHMTEHLGHDDGVLVTDETGCAPRGAEEPCGRRSPPLVIAVAG